MIIKTDPIHYIQLFRHHGHGYEKDFIACIVASPCRFSPCPAACKYAGGFLASCVPAIGLPDTVVITTNPPPSIKILNSTHFSWGYQSGEDVLAGGGRYTLEGDTLYTEFLEYHVTDILVGEQLRFSVRIVGDLWYHAGEFPSGYRLEEVWRRIE